MFRIALSREEKGQSDTHLPLWESAALSLSKRG
jgi:hypothetical protein